MSVSEPTFPASLRLEWVEQSTYRIPARSEDSRDVVNGVQLMASAIVASAMQGVGQQRVKSAHGIFSRPTARTSASDRTVDRFHSGRAFGADTVTVTQNGKNAARIQLLFTADEPDLIRHADPMPDVPGPEKSMPFQQSAVDIPSIEMRIAGGADYINSDHPLLPPQTNLWLRDTAPIEGDLANQALLCASTGTMLIGTAMLPHRGIGQDQAHRTISTGVVGHTIAFHEPFDLNDWLLLAQESVYAGRGRVHGRARVFDGRGQLVASYVQDAIIRHFSDGQDHTSEARTVM